MEILLETRLRRLRSQEPLRRLVRETQLSVNNLMMPIFVVPGRNIRREIPSMPGIFQLSVDQVVREVQTIAELKIPGVLLFGVPETKDTQGSEAYAKDGVVQNAVREIKSQLLKVTVATDVCLCAYMTHGHCGVVDKSASPQILNDATCELLAKVALSHAEAGADLIAPSDMMDGRIGVIRMALDDHGFSNLPIMSYAAKYASSFYGPFRDAQDSSPQFSDRKTYQMDPANQREALRAIERDLQEGADIIMVKPALSYLDIICRIRELTNVPIAAYSVSGEYAMICAAHQKGWIDGDQVMMESLQSMKRAGCDFIITYFAKKAAQLLR